MSRTALVALPALATFAAVTLTGCPHRGGDGPTAPGGAATWRTFTETHRASAVLVTPTNAWVGTDRGLVRWDLLTSEATVYSEDEGLASQPVRAMAIEPSGAVWVAGDRG